MNAMRGLRGSVWSSMLVVAALGFTQCQNDDPGTNTSDTAVTTATDTAATETNEPEDTDPALPDGTEATEVVGETAAETDDDTAAETADDTGPDTDTTVEVAEETITPPDTHLATPYVDNEPDDIDDVAPVSGTPFTASAYVIAKACSRRSYAIVDNCYNEVDPPTPAIMRSLARANLATAADTLPNAIQVPTDGSVDHVGKIQALPAARTTIDGRVSVAGGCDGCEGLQFRVFRPENVGHDATVVDSKHLVHEIRSDQYNWIGSLQSRFIVWDPTTSALTASATDGSGNLHLPDVLQSTLCEAASDRISQGHNGASPIPESLPDNPRKCFARFGEGDAIETGDCYDLTLLSSTVARASQSRWEFRGVDLTVFVRGPKRITTGNTGFPEGGSNFIWAYPRDPSGATMNAGIQTLPPFARFEIVRAFYQNPDGSKLLKCIDGNGNDLTGTNWWECFGGNKLPNTAKFAAQIRGPSGLCYDAGGAQKAAHPGFCEYFYRQHQAGMLNVDDNEDSTLGNGRAWNGTSGGCGNDSACHQDWAMFEPITTGDGKLLFLNIRGVFYAANTIGACRADGFTSFKPVSWMPADPAVKDTYDVARVTNGRPFRDTLGQPIPFGTNNTGAYPWIDRRGRNLFYAGQNLARDGWFGKAAQFFDYSGVSTGVVTQTNVGSPATAAQRPLLNPDHGPGTQYVLMGSWTQGKAVIPDELNVSDFGGGDAISQLPANSVGQISGYTMTLYTGAQTDVPFRSKGVQSVNSFEHVLGIYDAMRPTLPFDVVWNMQTDIMRNVDIAFDPYMNPRAVVVAHMNAPLDMHLPPRDGSGHAKQNAFIQDGFVAANPGASIRYGETADFRFKTSPRLQNAAAVDPDTHGGAVVPPSYLTLKGGARVEPIGMGGVLGKGVYLDGYNDHAEMAIPAQAQLADVFLSVWLDLRDEALGVRPRTIFYFADGSFIGLRKPLANVLELVAYDVADDTLRALPVAGLIQVGKWSHLGIALRGGPDDRMMEVRVDGTLLGTFAFDPSLTGGRGFELSPGTTGPAFKSYVGDPGPFLGTTDIKRRTWKGWVDELRIYAVTAAEQRDPSFGELACNEALGTLVDIASHDGETAHPALTQLRVKQALFAESPSVVCEQLVLVPGAGESLQASMLPKQHDKTLCADRVHHNPRPEADLAARCLRGPRLELPKMTWDQPRPDRMQATFCLTCHHDASGVQGLRLPALAGIDGLPRWQDPRRQPTQVPARLGGRRPSPLADFGLGENDPPDAPLDRYFDQYPYLPPQTE